MNINKLRTHRVSYVAIAVCVIVLTISVSAFTVLYDSSEQGVGIQTEKPISDSSIMLSGEGVNIPEREFAGLIYDNTVDHEMLSDINKVEFLTETRIESVPFEIIDCPVQTIPKGTREITQKGVEGKSENTYIVKYVDGKKTDEVLYSSKPVEYPTEEIANVGVGGVITGKDGKVYNFSYYKQMEATAYTYVPGLTTMTTATGRRLQKGIVAVDPTVIPLHTKLYITSDTVDYGYGEAEDTGGVIKGNIVDLAFMSYDECIQFGRRQMIVYILE